MIVLNLLNAFAPKSFTSFEISIDCLNIKELISELGNIIIFRIAAIPVYIFEVSLTIKPNFPFYRNSFAVYYKVILEELTTAVKQEISKSPKVGSQLGKIVFLLLAIDSARLSELNNLIMKQLIPTGLCVYISGTSANFGNCEQQCKSVLFDD